ncbi:uncharacterized protein (DUF2141 family) [Caulobacter ginsengisoli]|uniref:Uncharacterized protein (DUF2141 family) n=1 Tax=Caulobacter ginsengisoli TaxID=400775 RepID=A0ABU0IUJ3_9CAUL|nr:DUF2141 domain-containing protein [Caulobacter ginsengisoli]MDQ0464803.1 uncharacterized protein (DUF2141 family) [Caulobacter ginsengisoli]
MKAIASVVAVAALAFAGQALAGDVTVTLTGVQAKGGQVLVSLQKRDQFMQPTAAYGTKAPATAGDMTVTIKDVAAGDYAVVVMHDEDSNFQMAMADNGMPKEGWSMSGSPSMTSKPTFDEVKVAVPAEGASVTEAMVYPN